MPAASFPGGVVVGVVLLAHVVAHCGTPEPNVAELRAIKAEADQRLAQLKAQADRLAEHSRAAREGEAQVVVKVTSLPPIGANEGAEAARLRAEIADTQGRIAQLEEVVAEVEKINARRRELDERLKRMTELQDQRDR